jgi:exopolysaccharide production protein ExoQ
MSPSIACFFYAVGILGLFFLDRDKSLRTSKAIWLPVTWLWIVGSRPVSVWLGIAPTTGNSVEVENPVDGYVYLVLLIVGLIVLAYRGGKTIAVLKRNWPILAYWSFCLASIGWSDFPDVALKRWIKSIGDLAMVLVIVTDADPKGALKRVLSRVGFILLPVSVLLIKYFPDLGRGFSPWDGRPWNTGVTTNKNSLGVIVFTLALGALWSVLAILRAKRQPNRARHLLAQATMLCFGLALLKLANSATSLACFLLGAVLMIGTTLPAINRRPRAVHAVVLAMVLFGALVAFFGGGASVVHELGRKTDLTGRTEIWNALIPMAPNAAIGAGFESFWLGPRLTKVRDAFRGNPLNEAHNGYLEVYLNLGWVGVALIAWILISGYVRAASTFRRDPPFGSLLLAFVATSALYSVAEAGFRLLSPVWIFLLFAVVAASRTASISKNVPLRRLDSRPSDMTLRANRPASVAVGSRLINADHEA